MFDPISVMAALGGAVAAAGTLRLRPAPMLKPVERQERPTGADRRDTVELSHAARQFAATTDVGSSSATGGNTNAEDQSAEGQLTEQDHQEVQKLKQRDKEVRTHEQAHRSAGGAHAGAISLQFTQGPDGKRYAVEGSVSIDLSTIEGDPSATILKMQQVQRAALAPAGPSGADRRIAAQARRAEQQARSEMTAQKRNETETTKSATDDEQQTDGAVADQRAQVDLTNPYAAAAAGGIEQLTSARFLNLLA